MRYAVVITALALSIAAGCNLNSDDRLAVEGKVSSLEDKAGSQYAELALEDGRKFLIEGNIPGRFGGEGALMRFYMERSCEGSLPPPSRCVEVDSTEVLEIPPKGS